jgi:hypothetical protein
MSFAPPPVPTPPPPPQPLSAEAQRVAPPLFLWGLPVASALALIGAVLPWFKPTFDGRTFPDESVVHSWNTGKIGLIGPVLLLVLGVLTVLLLLGRTPSRLTRSGRHPLQSLARNAAVAGVITLGTMAAAWVLVPQNFGDWNEAEAAAKSAGIALGRGPLPGFWLVVVAGVLGLLFGAVLFFQTRSAQLAAEQPWAVPPEYQP